MTRSTVPNVNANRYVTEHHKIEDVVDTIHAEYWMASNARGGVWTVDEPQIYPVGISLFAERFSIQDRVSIIGLYCKIPGYIPD